MRTRFYSACLIALLGAGLWPATHHAAPLPGDAKPGDGPTLILQAQSLDEIDAKFRNVFKSIPFPVPEEDLRLEKIFEEMGFDLNGIDRKRRFAAYVTLQENLFASEAVILIPVTKEADFVECLGQLDITAKKAEDGYTLDIPDFPLPAYMIFADDYAYISVGTDTPLKGKNRVVPAAVIDPKENAIVMARAYIDRMPVGLKDLALAQMDELPGLVNDDEFDNKRFAESLRGLLTMTQRWVKLGLNDGKELEARFDINPKSGASSQEFILTPKSGSTLAKNFDRTNPTNMFASLASKEDVLRYQIRVPLFEDELKSFFSTLVDYAIEEGKSEGPDTLAKMYAEFGKGLKANIEAGDADTMIVLRGPNAKSQYTAVGGFTFRGADDLAKAWKESLKTPPEGYEGVFEFDVKKVNGVDVHAVKLLKLADPPQEAEEGLKRTFGDPTIYYAFGADRIVAAIGPEAESALGDALTAKAGPASPVLIDMDGAKFAKFLEVISGEKLPFGVAEMVGLDGRMPLLKIDVDLDGNLKVKLESSSFTGFPMLGIAGARMAPAQQFQPVPAAIPAPAPAPPPPPPPPPLVPAKPAAENLPAPVEDK